MTLLAYVVRRTIGALLVFLIVVLLTQFAVANLDAPPLRGGPSVIGPQLAAWARWSESWATFPVAAVSMLGLVAAVVVVRRRLSR